MGLRMVACNILTYLIMRNWQYFLGTLTKNKGAAYRIGQFWVSVVTYSIVCRYLSIHTWNCLVSSMASVMVYFTLVCHDLIACIYQCGDHYITMSREYFVAFFATLSPYLFRWWFLDSEIVWDCAINSILLIIILQTEASNFKVPRRNSLPALVMESLKIPPINLWYLVLTKVVYKSWSPWWVGY